MQRTVTVQVSVVSANLFAHESLEYHIGDLKKN